MSDEVKEVSVSEETGVSDGKLVPVSESIRYRKRAQSAEKQAEDFKAGLDEMRQENGQLREKVEKLETERKLIDKLSRMHVSDMDGAMVIARDRMSSDSECDVDSVLQQLRNEKPYLFSSGVDGDFAGAAEKTSGVRQKVSGGQGVLRRAAGRAAQSGKDTDLMEYMKVRRSVK